jgi:DNA-binding MarR family transcriptional regulator
LRIVVVVARIRAVDPASDVGLLARAVSDGVSERVHQQLAAEGYDDVRQSHETVLEGLLAGDTTVTALAGRFGISAQAVSKTVAELVRAGYLARDHDAEDRRARPLRLTARGEALVDATRGARQAVARDLGRWLGTRDDGELVRLLQHAVERLDALDAVRDRRWRPPS